MKYVEGSITIGNKTYYARIAQPDVDEESEEFVEKATYDNKVAELQAVIDNLQETGGSSSGSSGSDTVDLSILENLTFVQSQENSDVFYVSAEGAGMVKLNPVQGSVESIGSSGHDYRVILDTEGAILVEDDSKLYWEDTEEEIDYDVANATILPWQILVNKMVFIPIVVGESTYKTIIIGMDTRALLDVVDFRLGTAVNGVRTEMSDTDVLVFSPDCSQALHVRRDWENDNYDSLIYKNVISVSNANKITEDVEASFWGTDSFSILVGATGIWKATTTSIEKIATGEGYQLIGREEEDGVYYVLFENGSAGLKVNQEDGTYASYTPMTLGDRLVQSNWLSDVGITLSFDSNGNYSITDEDGKYFDSDDLTGTYNVNEDGIVVLTGTNNEMNFEYEKESKQLMWFSEYLGDMVWFWQE